MERLFDVLQSTEHDLVILDTPPTRSALDILDAPGRLVRFLDRRVLDAFVGDGRKGARAWVKARGTEVAIKLFGAMAGDALMEELVGFFQVFMHLRRGFAERASFVLDRLGADSTAFVLVTAPDATHLADAAYLRDGLLERGTRIEALVFNRAFHAAADGSPLAEATPWPDEALSGPGSIGAVRSAARALRARLVRQNRRAAEAIEAFQEQTPGTVSTVTLPVLESEPSSLQALSALLLQGR